MVKEILKCLYWPDFHTKDYVPILLSDSPLPPILLRLYSWFWIPYVVHHVPRFFRNVFRQNFLPNYPSVQFSIQGLYMWATL